MTVLVLSDSHSTLSFMRRCTDAVKPHGIIHLGDHYDDGEVLHGEYPDIPFYQVPGNCDTWRCPPETAEIAIVRIFGVDIYMTHGHRHGVKQQLGKLLADARKAGVQAVLYGHTHIPNCYREADGLWVLNPGSCGFFGGSAGIMEIENKKITACRILKQEDLEGFA